MCSQRGIVTFRDPQRNKSYSFSSLLLGPNSIIKGCCHYSARLQILAFLTRFTPVRIPVLEIMGFLELGTPVTSHACLYLQSCLNPAFPAAKM